MKIITGEIKDVLANHDYGIAVSVERAFTPDDKVFPRIIVSEINNSTGYTAGDELTSILAFQIDIYTKNGIIDGELMGRVDLADEIAKQIDRLIADNYGMNRDGYSPDVPFATDVNRRIMRYSCAIDYHDYVYRSN